VRWKLLIITSVLAALVGVGGISLVFYLYPGPPTPATRPMATAAALLFPLAAITFASIFVYRHTARRRKTQAAATALLSFALTLAVLFASTFLLVCCEPPPQPLPPPTPRGAT